MTSLRDEATQLTQPQTPWGGRTNFSGDVSRRENPAPSVRPVGPAWVRKAMSTAQETLKSTGSAVTELWVRVPALPLAHSMNFNNEVASHCTWTPQLSNQDSNKHLTGLSGGLKNMQSS